MTSTYDLTVWLRRALHDGLDEQLEVDHAGAGVTGDTEATLQRDDADENLAEPVLTVAADGDHNRRHDTILIEDRRPDERVP